MVKTSQPMPNIHTWYEMLRNISPLVFGSGRGLMFDVPYDGVHVITFTLSEVTFAPGKRTTFVMLLYFEGVDSKC